MSSGSGPMAVAVATAALSTTAETVIATIPASNWNDNIGNLLTASVIATASGAATVTFRVRQASLTGAVVTGSTSIYTFAGAAATVDVCGSEFVDSSSFALTPTFGGQYVLTAQASVSSTVTPTGGMLSLETIAPVQ
jgi:hypothetical protein